MGNEVRIYEGQLGNQLKIIGFREERDGEEAVQVTSTPLYVRLDREKVRRLRSRLTQFVGDHPQPLPYTSGDEHHRLRVMFYPDDDPRVVFIINGFDLVISEIQAEDLHTVLNDWLDNEIDIDPAEPPLLVATDGSIKEAEEIE